MVKKGKGETSKKYKGEVSEIYEGPENLYHLLWSERWEHIVVIDHIDGRITFQGFTDEEDAKKACEGRFGRRRIIKIYRVLYRSPLSDEPV